MIRNSILIVDDEEVNRIILEEILKAEYRVFVAENGKEALSILEKEHACIAAVLLDLEMPVMNGYQFLETALCTPEIEKIPIVVETSEDASDALLRVYDYGVYDVIRKPYNKKEVLKRVRNIVSLAEYREQLEDTVKIQTEALNQKVKELARINEELIDALSSVVEFRDLETGEHIQRIKDYTRVLCNLLYEKHPECGLSARKINLITSASAMHDIGKIAIPDAILFKPGKLTPEEFEVIKTHTTKGVLLLDKVKIFADSDYLEFCKNICLYHHEKYDGKGYPMGLKGDEIPLEAQIVSIADVFDALVSKRIYKEAYSVETAYEMIMNGECGVFSERMLECFKECLEEFKKIALASFEKERKPRE